MRPGDIIPFQRPAFDETAYQLGGLRGRCIGPANAEFPFQSEGTTIALQDGTLWHAYNLRYAENKTDGWHAHYARTAIAVVKSSDEGRTWSDPEALFVSPTGANVSHPGFVRTAQGHIGIAYQRIETIPPEEWTSKGYWVDKVKEAFKVYRWSEDEGKTWSDEVVISPRGDYWTSAHDRLTCLSSGRLVLPLHNIYTKDKENECIGTALAWSDDHGKTWQKSRILKVESTVSQYDGPAAEQATFHEASVAQRADGSLLMFGRTTMGRVYMTESFDQGETWYDPKPTNIFNSKAPVNIKRIPDSDDLLMVWNSHSVLPANRQCGYRLTLSAAISQDGGKTWKRRREIESITPWPQRDDKSMGVHKVCYPSISFHNQKAYIAYWVCAPLDTAQAANWTRGAIDQQYLSVLPLDWFYAHQSCHAPQEVGALLIET